MGHIYLVEVFEELVTLAEHAVNRKVLTTC